MNYPITRHRDRYPSPYCAQAWICSWYLLLVYTRYNSNPTAVSCTGILPCSLIRSATTDFRISQYSCTHISYWVFSTRGVFSNLLIQTVCIKVDSISYRTLRASTTDNISSSGLDPRSQHNTKYLVEVWWAKGPPSGNIFGRRTARGERKVT